jgi:Holliday junction resolvase RusA-like endonuclease
MSATTTTAAFAFQIDDIPPSLNNAYKNVIIKGRSQRALTADAKKWKADTAKQIRAGASRQGWSIDKGTLLDITIHYWAPNVLVWDLDGKVKLLLDAFCEVFHIDDRYVIDLHLKKRRSPTRYLRMRVALSQEEL